MMSSFSIRLRSFKKQLLLWGQYAFFRVSHPFLWCQPLSLPSADAKRVLFITLNDWVPRATLDATLARGMLEQGHRPFILLYRSSTWAQRYFRAFGIHSFVFFDDYLRAAVRDGDDALVSSWVRQHASFQALLRFEFEGFPLGKHVLSTTVNTLKCGSIDFDDPTTLRVLHDLFLLSLRTIRASAAFLKEIAPDIGLWMERGYTPTAEIFEQAMRRQCVCIQYFHGHRSDGLLMRRYRPEGVAMHGFSLSSESWKIARALPWTAADEEKFMVWLREKYATGAWFNQKFSLQNKHDKSPEAIRSQLGLDPKKKVAIIFSHVLWDGTFFHGNNLFDDYEQWLVETVRTACANTEVQWIIKLHPDYVWKVQQMGTRAGPREGTALQRALGNLPPHLRIIPPDIDITTHSFFSIMDYCITVRGTIGIEAPCFGIPVFTAGTGRYAGLGFTNDSSNREEYLAKIASLQSFPSLPPEQVTLARKHAYMLFEKRVLPFTLCEIAAIPSGTRCFTHQAILRAHTIDDLRLSPQLRAFMDWVFSSTDEDYLAPL